MELTPLPLSAWNLSALRVQGDARAAVRRAPRTVEQVLHDAWREMTYEEAFEHWVRGEPVPQLRRPRKTLRMWLRGQRPEPPAMPPPMTAVELIWRSNPPA